MLLTAASGSNRQNGLGYLLVVLIAFFASHASGQRLVTFPLPHQPVEIQADLYGSGTRAVILAHGGRFGKESWKKQAEAIANAGFLVLAIRFRGDRSNWMDPGSFLSPMRTTQHVLAAVSSSSSHRCEDRLRSRGEPGWRCRRRRRRRVRTGQHRPSCLPRIFGRQCPGKAQRTQIIYRRPRR